MKAARVAELLSQKGQHRFNDARIDRGRCCMVSIDTTHNAYCVFLPSASETLSANLGAIGPSPEEPKTSDCFHV